MENKTITDLATANQLTFIPGQYNIIGCGIRTGKTYWAIHNLQHYTRDNNLSRILYLVDTNSLKEQICQDYSDYAISADNYWEPTIAPAWDVNGNKMGVMCYQRLAQYVIQDKLKFLDNIDVICWDECDSIFDFATQAFSIAYKKDFARAHVKREEILAIIQQYSSNQAYAPLILLGQWEHIINEGRILCIGLSATPERAKMYYGSLVQSSTRGRLEASYRINGDIFFYDIMALIRELSPMPGKGIWCYSPWIETNKTIVEAAKRRGFRAIELHSKNNDDKPLDDEQRRVYDCIVNTSMVPYEYDFVVFNSALLRGINLKDRRFDSTIINSLMREAREQAGRQVFSYQRYLKVLIPKVPETFMNRYLGLDECRELAQLMDVRDISADKTHLGRQMSWNRLKEVLSSAGYTVKNERKTINGTRKNVYIIEGEWQYAEVEDLQFSILADAKPNSIKLDEIDESFGLSGEVNYNNNLQLPKELEGVAWTH